VAAAGIGPVELVAQLGYLRLESETVETGTSETGTSRGREPMKRNLRTLSLLTASIALSLCASMPASAQNAPPTSMIIVDGSGSMWGNLGSEKRAKLEIVRDAMRALLPSLKPEARIGIASFGHRRRGNCGDAEVILPPDTNAPQRLALPIDKLNAVGKGPVVLALREAVTAMAGANPGSVILVADDIDNCGQDICRAMSGIMASSPNLVVHTIALGLDSAKVAHISCIARMTGGKLWNALDAAGVQSALGQAIELAHLQTGSESAASEAEAAPSDKPAEGAPPGLYLSVGLGAKSATLDTPVHWRITKAGGSGEVVRDTRAAALYEKLAPGSYDVEAELGLARARQTVDVEADKATEVRINLNGGVMKMQTRATAGGALLEQPIFMVTPANAAKDTPPLWIGRDAQPEIVLPAGEYVVTAETNVARQQNKVTIAPATGTSLNAVLSAGTLELSATRGTPSSPGDQAVGDVTFIIYQDDPDAAQGRREVVRSSAANPSFVLPAGTYYITARTPTSEVREQIAMGAGDTVKQVMTLSMARIRLAASLGGRPVTAENPITFRIVRLGAEPHEVLRTTGKEPEFDLSAGRYRIEASLGNGNVMAASEINLSAGQAQKITLPLAGGSVTLKRANATGFGHDVFWEVRDDKQRIVLRSSRAEPTAVLAPGRYLVSAETADQPLRNTIEVKANEHRTFDLAAP